MVKIYKLKVKRIERTKVNPEVLWISLVEIAPKTSKKSCNYLVPLPISCYSVTHYSVWQTVASCSYYSKPALKSYYNFSLLMGFITTAMLFLIPIHWLLFPPKLIKSLGCGLLTGVAYWLVNTVSFAHGQDFKYNNMPTVLGCYHALLLWLE